jgi:hypothetical protein
VLAPLNTLPDAARERAGRLLWDRLLRPIDDPETDEQDDEERPDETAA